jgi:D-glycero-D-manno-heptose 1,7-bisphosphate phosphatase
VSSEYSFQEDTGLFCQRVSKADFTGKPCLFLDRDGVLVEETNYLHRCEDVVMLEDAAKAVAAANAAGVAVVIVTNQAGIGRGYYSWNDFQRVQEHILGLCRSAGAAWDLALACAYHAEGVPPYNDGAHPWRKPRPGMLLAAERTLGIDLSLSHIVGDTLADLEAGAQAGLAGGSLVLTGHGEREWRDRGHAAFSEFERSGSFRPRLAADAAEAIHSWLNELTAKASAA